MNGIPLAKKQCKLPFNQSHIVNQRHLLICWNSNSVETKAGWKNPKIIKWKHLYKCPERHGANVAVVQLSKGVIHGGKLWVLPLLFIIITELPLKASNLTAVLNCCKRSNEKSLENQAFQLKWTCFSLKQQQQQLYILACPSKLRVLDMSMKSTAFVWRLTDQMHIPC